jgi:curved DNA-binding protein CbpA
MLSNMKEVTKMVYFNDCNTNEEVKKKYKEMAKKLHPDCGGNEKEFKEMCSQYEKAFDKYKNVFTNADGETYKKETNETFDIFKDIIDIIISMENIDIEIIGSWIWCTGNTKEYKEKLKELGFKWSQKKCAWSFYFGEWKKHYKKNYTLEEIRSKYGSEKIIKEKQEYEKIA